MLIRARNQTRSLLAFWLTILSPVSTATAGLFAPEPIVGLCTTNKSVFERLIREDSYVLKQTSEARDGRTVMYFKADDFMIVVADEDDSKWCIQFTSYDEQELIKFLLGRYDRTTRGDEGTD